MKKTLTLILLVFLGVTYTKAEDIIWKWGENETEAHGNWNYLVRLIDQGKYDEARKPLNWLLKNTPDLNIALYINASKVYEGCVKDTKDKALENQLEDSALVIYDVRKDIYGDEATVLNRKGRIAWAYLHDREGQIPELYKLYKRTYELNGTSTYLSNVNSYFKAACAMYSGKLLSKEDVLALHGKLYEDLDARETKSANNPKKLDKISKYRDKIDNLVGYYELIDCDYIESTYGEKWKAQPSLKLAERVNSMLITGGCKSSDLFFETSDKIINEGESSFALLKLVANAHYNKKEFDEAYNYYQKAIEASDDSAKSGDIYLKLATIDHAKGRYANARTNAYNAIKYNADNSASGYSLIGELYMGSYQKCGSDELTERLVFLAAYDKFKMAGNSSRMTAAKAQFPRIDDIFSANHQEGDVMNTGCWIGENVTLIRR